LSGWHSQQPKSWGKSKELPGYPKTHPTPKEIRPTPVVTVYLKGQQSSARALVVRQDESGAPACDCSQAAEFTSASLMTRGKKVSGDLGFAIGALGGWDFHIKISDVN